jgi:YgiT-type zinc finger domain-containing protein
MKAISELFNSIEKCPVCGFKMVYEVRPFIYRYRGNSISVDQLANYCNNCGESFLSPKDYSETETALYKFIKNENKQELNLSINIAPHYENKLVVYCSSNFYKKYFENEHIEYINLTYVPRVGKTFFYRIYKDLVIIKLKDSDNDNTDITIPYFDFYAIGLCAIKQEVLGIAFKKLDN